MKQINKSKGKKKVDFFSIQENKKEENEVGEL